MGCGDSTPEDDANREINRNNRDAKILDSNIRKLLLLGTGGSGKSTIFRNLKKIHGLDICDDRTRGETANTVRTNLITGMYTLLARSASLYNMDSQLNKDCFLDLETDEKLAKCVELVIKNGNDPLEPTSTNDDMLEDLGKALDTLWNLDPIQATYAKRGGNFSFPDNLDFFFKKVKTVMTSKYEPSEEDIIKARVRTTGVVGYEYKHKDLIFSITDVGGQRNERKKWIHQFESVSAVIYVAALNHYNSVLFEDEKENAMHEALKVYAKTINLQYFTTSEVILFLNKNDLFEIQLRSEVPLDVCFSRSAGWTGKEEWLGPNYRKQSDPDKDELVWKECYGAAIKFISDLFDKRNGITNRVIYSHVTEATDSTNVDKVFLDVQHTVIRSNLKNGGLLA